MNTFTSVRIILAASVPGRTFGPAGSSVARQRAKPAPCPGKRW